MTSHLKQYLLFSTFYDKIQKSSKCDKEKTTTWQCTFLALKPLTHSKFEYGTEKIMKKNIKISRLQNCIKSSWTKCNFCKLICIRTFLVQNGRGSERFIKVWMHRPIGLLLQLFIIRGHSQTTLTWRGIYVTLKMSKVK